MATVAILIWPLIAMIMFARLAPVKALIWGVLIPYLLLPEKFVIGLPGLPDLDKTSVITLGVVLGLLTNQEKFAKQALLKPTVIVNHKFRKLITICMILIFAGIVMTVMSNRDVLRYGDTALPGMRPWDIVSMFGSFLFFVAPFLFARKYLSSAEAHRALLSAFVISALYYSLLMLIEIRLSPQLHNWVYGYHQHSFLQHVRDGYRPKVFLQHGLWVGFFIYMATIAAAILWKVERKPFWMASGIWLFLILGMSENLAATLIAIIFLGLIFLSSRKMQLRVVFVVAVCILFFPILRQAQLIPFERITNAAATISEDRAGSLQFRLDNEDELLVKALERPVSGWGSFGRERVYDERGRDTSISEGRWIQTISTRGWVGYIGLFGLLSLPVLLLRRTGRRKEIPLETVGLAIIVAGNFIYMVPNSTLTAIGWLVFGALAGFVQSDSKAPEETPEDEAGPRVAVTRKNRYTRFGPKTPAPTARRPRGA